MLKSYILSHSEAWKGYTIVCFAYALSNPIGLSAMILWGIGSIVIWFAYEVTG